MMNVWLKTQMNTRLHSDDEREGGISYYDIIHVYDRTQDMDPSARKGLLAPMVENTVEHMFALL